MAATRAPVSNSQQVASITAPKMMVGSAIFQASSLSFNSAFSIAKRVLAKSFNSSLSSATTPARVRPLISLVGMIPPNAQRNTQHKSENGSAGNEAKRILAGQALGASDGSLGAFPDAFGDIPGPGRKVFLGAAPDDGEALLHVLQAVRKFLHLLDGAADDDADALGGMVQRQIGASLSARDGRQVGVVAGLIRRRPRARLGISRKARFIVRVHPICHRHCSPLRSPSGGDAF